ncbi:MAG: UxaA family hydrolase [Rubrobacteraceae bacterium]
MNGGHERTLNFEDAGRLPAPGDNVAIATRRLDTGTCVSHENREFTVGYTILEGHRFAVRNIPEGEDLISWGLRFGQAVRSIAPGDYVCNPKILKALSGRQVGFELPPEPNFRDAELKPYFLDEEGFRPGEQVSLYKEPRTFMGYRRGGNRGVGTRNYVVVLGVTSRVSGYAKTLEARLSGLSDDYEDVSGVVAVAHTEGGEDRTPNNLNLLLKTLSGFAVNPNVGAVLVVDEGGGVVTNAMLRDYMREHDYPLSDVPHRFMSLNESFGASLRAGETLIRGLLELADGARRKEEPVSNLRVALQCGGSDAFSGVSANPLAGWVAKEIIRNGGGANLAETDELIGAEHYILKNVRDLDTARRFLDTVERFKERVGWHGHTAEDNPSGGNNYRGLYNISIKSLGAAMKRDPEVRLDHVIEYAQRMEEPGYHFMDSPGNDLESVAGQVASGANMIFFTTGNGSITNFPFVPTIKLVTTTGRYELLSKDMDVNAGAYLDGTPMEDLGREMFEYTIEAASGKKTVGERAGHSQVSIWRDWKQTGTENLERLLETPEPDGKPLPVRGGDTGAGLRFEAFRTGRGYVADQVGLVMPTSLCSGQIALRIAERLNERDAGDDKLSRFVALPHTEGCGVSAGSAETLYARTVLGYLAHPLVRVGLLLEHGCEKTHNDYFRNRLTDQGLDPERFGWASVQLDGGIDAVVEKVDDWFVEALEGTEALHPEPVGLEHLKLGLHSSGPLSDEAARNLARLTLAIVGAGGTVVVPERATMMASRAYLDDVLDGRTVWNTLAYGQRVVEPGLHVMESPTDHWVETATGLGATGVEVMLAHVAGRPLQSHRMIPLIQAASDPGSREDHGEDLDLLLTGDPSLWTDAMLCTVLDVASRRYTPKLFAQGNIGFQFTRGLLGVSM